MDDKKQLPCIEHLQSLEEAKEKINSMTNLAAMNWNRVVYELGSFFLDVKELAGYGKWKKWVKENIELVSYETATHYMAHFEQCKEAGHLIDYNPTGNWKSRKNARVAFLKAGMPPELYTGNDERATTKPESEEKTNEPEDDFPFPRHPWYYNKEYKLWSPGKAARAIIEKYGEVTRYRGMKEIVEVTKWPRPPSWWKFVSSVSMPEKFLPQLPYNERSQSDQGLGIPLKQPSTASLVLDLSIHRFVAGGSDH